MITPEETALIQLYKKYKGSEPSIIKALPSSGSYRKYFRLQNSENKSVIGVYNEDIRENKAFKSFTSTFIENDLPVPNILADNISENVYIIDDLGDTTLLNYLSEKNNEHDFSIHSINIYKKVIDYLPLFQIIGGKTINFSDCYPRHSFDKQSMIWDLNYFKYYFLKMAKIQFDEQKLEDDFQVFSDFLLKADCIYFMYRDFQSRNIMIVEDKPYFIDYQGGRKGALQYDIASLLFEAKTALSPDFRDELLDYYLSALSKHIVFKKNKFLEYYHGYAYIRLMQAMGAYGFRGLYEKKELFLQSIPNAQKHLDWLLKNVILPIKLPELIKVWHNLVESHYIKQIALNTISLKININSFSYKRSVPVDETQNGGGFIFDCRAWRNPGRFEKYEQYTGKDNEIHEFFKKKPDVDFFLEHIFAIVDKTIDEYSSRGFTDLMVNFGCTGGQHRSVYAAERMNNHIKEKYPGIIVKLRHRELEMIK